MYERHDKKLLLSCGLVVDLQRFEVSTLQDLESAKFQFFKFPKLQNLNHQYRTARREAYHHQNMKAVVWENHLDSVSVKDVPKPKISDKLDAIVRVTSAAICGSELHTYHKRLAVPAGTTLGHEAVGIVEEVGDGVEAELVQVGDRVVILCEITCGRCDNCVVGKTAFCLTRGKISPGSYGIPDVGVINQGCQGMLLSAGFLRRMG